MYHDPWTRTTWSPFFTGRAAGDAGADFAGETLAVFDFAEAGMARMWAVTLYLSIRLQDGCGLIQPAAEWRASAAPARTAKGVRTGNARGFHAPPSRARASQLSRLGRHVKRVGRSTHTG